MSRRAKWLPPWPVVPPRLWAPAGVAGLAVVSLVFERELWPNTPGAGTVSVVALYGALLATGPQVAVALWCWPAAYAGPRWLGVAFRLVATSVALGLLALEALGFLVAVGEGLAWAARQ